MEQQLVIVRTDEFQYGDSCQRQRQREVVPLSRLTLGAEISLSPHRTMKVTALTDEELSFSIDLRNYTLNRYWQVLGTVKMDSPTDGYSVENERYTFLFETPVQHVGKGLYEQMAEMMDKMREHTQPGDFYASWKNIPLAREMMHLFKDATPLRDEEINPLVRMMGVSAIADEKMLPVKDVPRLFLSYCEYWNVCRDLLEEGDGEQKKLEEDAQWYDDQVFKYSWSVDPTMTSELYDKLFGKDQFLRFDPLQLSPEWEKAIYDIELQVEKMVEGESRGMGFCFSYWSAKTAAARQHGLHWRAPDVMNPGVMFD